MSHCRSGSRPCRSPCSRLRCCCWGCCFGRGWRRRRLGAYLLEGAAGLPVFAPGLALGAGMAHLLGPTGGYLMSYPAAAALIAFLWRRSRRGFGAALLSAAAGDAVILMCGFLWMATLTHGAFSYGSVKTAFALAVLPFLPGDALKVVAAAAIARGMERAATPRFLTVASELFC